MADDRERPGGMATGLWGRCAERGATESAGRTGQFIASKDVVNGCGWRIWTKKLKYVRIMVESRPMPLRTKTRPVSKRNRVGVTTGRSVARSKSSGRKSVVARRGTTVIRLGKDHPKHDHKHNGKQTGRANGKHSDKHNAEVVEVKPAAPSHGYLKAL